MKSFKGKAAPEEKAHAEFGASSSERWLNCPGSLARIKDAPPAPESDYAAEGTQAHSCLEFLLKNRGKLQAAKASALKRFEPEMVEHALDAIAWIQDRLKEAGPHAELLCETKVDSSHFTCAGQFGTLDVAIVDEFGTLVVLDYKYGAGIGVEPQGSEGTGNPQLIYYGLGISKLYEHNFANVELVVIQPRAYHESGETIRTHTMDMDTFLAWEGVFREGVLKAQEPDALLKSGPWCKFCPAAIGCPEIKLKGFEKAAIVFNDANGVIESMPEPLVTPVANLGRMLEGAEHLEAWITRLRAHAIQVLERGGEVPGWKLVQKRSPRRWKDVDAAVKAAGMHYGKKAFTEPKLLSPAQMEKLLKGEPSLPGFIESYVTAESSGTTLAPASDKRPAVKTIKEVFAEPAALAPPALQFQLPSAKKAAKKK